MIDRFPRNDARFNLVLKPVEERPAAVETQRI